MSTIEIIGGSAAAVIATGAYLKWATLPVVLAYRVGRDVERLAASPARYVPAFKAGYGIGRRNRHRD